MGIWNYYVVTEEKAVRFEDARQALQAAHPNFDLDGDLIVLRNGYGGSEELECGQLTIQPITDPALFPDRAFLEEQIEGKKSRERLLKVLEQARCLVVLQLLNTGYWWDNEPRRTLRPLQEWLIHNFEGALWVDGGEVYDRHGRIP
jgi:hypothetical protein